MVSQADFHFGWVYTFSVQPSSLRNWCNPMSETSCNPALPVQLCGSFCQHPSLTVLLVILDHMAFLLATMCFIVSFSRDTWHDNRFVVFNVLGGCLFWKCIYIILALSSIYYCYLSVARLCMLN